MTDRVFEDARSWEVSNNGREVEVYVFDSYRGCLSEVTITVREESDWDSQRASFALTAEEATALKEFLIRKGY